MSYIVGAEGARISWMIIARELLGKEFSI